MKNLTLITIATIIGMTTASPLKCQQPATCSINAECCEGEGPHGPYTRACAQRETGMCELFNFNTNPSSMNEPCEVNEDCFTRTCEQGYCAPDLVGDGSPAQPDGTDCTYDYQCRGGWCAPAAGSSGVCTDRCKSTIDPPKWKVCE